MRVSTWYKSRFSVFPLKSAAALLFPFLLAPNALAATATTTQLRIVNPSVPVGSPALLVATVADASSHPVLLGTVTFYDGVRVLGSAQIVNRSGGIFPQGTANLKTSSFAPGVNGLTAVFSGTVTDAASTSAAKTITVTGKSATAIALTAVDTAGQYSLTALFQAFGLASPTGNVDFLETTTGTTLGTQSLAGVVLNNSLLPAGASLQGGNQLAAGDFNGDGFLDLAISGPSGGAATMLGKGDGTFHPPGAPSGNGVGIYSLVLRAGDFDNDGKLDLALGDNFGGFYFLQGNGDGTFQPPVSLGGGFEILDAAVADLNRDGKLDIVALDPYLGTDSHLYVWISNGDGTFQPQQNIDIPGGNYSALVVGDVNGDGIPDLVAASSWGPFSVFIGVGDGTFEPARLLPFETSSYNDYGSPALALSDLNGDGKLDLVVSDISANTVSVALGDGLGGFALPTKYAVNLPGKPVVADIDQDGKLDIAINGQGTNLQLLSGNGDGTFKPAIVSATLNASPSSSFNLIEGDWNGDTRPDLVATIGGETVLLNGQSATFSLPNIPQLVPAPEKVHAGYSGDASYADHHSNTLVLQPLGLDFSGGFAGSAATVQLNGSATVDGPVLQLTPSAQQQAASAFLKTPLNIQAFTTDFTFQILNPTGDGFTFTVQNAGPSAVGAPGGGLGYRSIRPSAAIKFDLYNNMGEGRNSTGVYTGGDFPAVPSVDLTGSGIDLHSQHPIKAHITYDGQFLVLTLTDTVTNATWSHVWTIDIPGAVGVPTAYVGFTAGTGDFTSTETITSWTYSASVPPPNFPIGFYSSPFLWTTSSFGECNCSLYLADTGGRHTVVTGFYEVPQNIQDFTTDFAFQILNPGGDGFTFTIQNAGYRASGSDGGDLGYRHISESVAIKFDIYNNSGEGPNSTGIYTNGQRPTLPAIDLTGSGIDLHSQHTFLAHITYHGVSLHMTLTDTVTHATWSHTWSIDIPSVVGAPTAYVGFTGATGTSTSTESLNNWTFEPGTP